MAAGSLEDRVAALETQVALLLRRSPSADQRPGWQRALGRFTGDEVMRAIDEAALDYREEDRRHSLAEFDVEQGDLAGLWHI